MTFDAVADGLRKYHKETDQAKRIRWLEKLAPTGDPRVAVLLAEVAVNGNGDAPGWETSFYLLSDYFVGANPLMSRRSQIATSEWWKEHEADIRRRAAQLPR